MYKKSTVRFKVLALFGRILKVLQLSFQPVYIPCIIYVHVHVPRWETVSSSYIERHQCPSLHEYTIYTYVHMAHPLNPKRWKCSMPHIPYIHRTRMRKYHLQFSIFGTRIDPLGGNCVRWKLLTLLGDEHFAFIKWRLSFDCETTSYLENGVSFNHRF